MTLRAALLTDYFEAAVGLEGADVTSTEVPHSIDGLEVFTSLLRVLVVTHSNVAPANQNLTPWEWLVPDCVATWWAATE